MQQEHGQSDIAIRQGKGRAIIFSLLILFSGAVIGSGLTLITISHVRPKPDEKGWEWVSNHMIHRMVGELGLTADQQQQLDPIVRKHMKALDDLRRAARPKFTSQMTMMNEEILSVLDENQQQIWQDKMEKMRDRFSRPNRNREGRGPGREGDRNPGQGRGRRDGTGQGRGPGMGREDGPPPPLRPDGEFPPKHPPHDPNQMQQE